MDINKPPGGIVVGNGKVHSLGMPCIRVPLDAAVVGLPVEV